MGGDKRGGRGVRDGIAEARVRGARPRETLPDRAVAVAAGISSPPATGRETGRETKRARHLVPSRRLEGTEHSVTAGDDVAAMQRQ